MSDLYTDMTKHEYPAIRCVACGRIEADYYTSRMRDLLIEHQLCFSCNHWREVVESDPKTVINNHVYTPGERRSGSFRGMAGRRFDIRYKNNLKITTFDLWSGGDVPHYWQDKIPNTAEFVSGRKAVVGGTTCWNSSSFRGQEFNSPKVLGQYTREDLMTRGTLLSIHKIRRRPRIISEEFDPFDLGA